MDTDPMTVQLLKNVTNKLIHFVTYYWIVAAKNDPIALLYKSINK